MNFEENKKHWIKRIRMKLQNDKERNVVLSKIKTVELRNEVIINTLTYTTS